MGKQKPKLSAEIQQEIEKLEEMKPFVRQFSHFGGDNHAKIDAELTALRDMHDEEDADELWPDEEDCEVRSAAQYAIRWMDGEEKESPSEGWACLDSRNKKVEEPPAKKKRRK